MNRFAKWFSLVSVVSVVSVVFVVALTGRVAWAEDGKHNLGLGVILFDPTGFSLKYVRDSRIAFDAALGWDNDDDLYIHGDILWQHPRLFESEGHWFDAYYGLGLRLLDHDHDHDGRRRRRDHDDDVHVGLRAPVGLRYLFRDPRIEIFTEVAFIMDVTPSTDADVDFALGARYYF